MDLRPVSHPIRFNIPNRLYIEFQIAALFSNNFISWREVGDIALYVLVALVVVDVLMLYVWHRIGPRPRKSTRELEWESRPSHAPTRSS
ncbi:unnamed protein product [Effrenium voratum]|uniref:Uncharacterized protein n=1 Tax=Effrenium voratum TaxID=2562239 RepID=A0AA36ICS2_9DINO|nr:unnamed protein product [Effrenium voratum]